MCAYRHELKYYINARDRDLLRLRLKELMRPDPHAGAGGVYRVRSLYFDDYWNSSYADKLAGVYHRKKYRIRLYNCDGSFIRLERKEKRDQYIHKVSAALSRPEVEDLLAGRYGFLLGRKEPLLQEFYYCCTSRVMRPCVLVDYEREPYIYGPGDVRVTFDSDVRSTGDIENLFEPDLPVLGHVLDQEKLVMEVKFTEFLPQFIRRALTLESEELVALSKFTSCVERSKLYFELSTKYQ